MTDVINAALTHLVESETNIQNARDEHPPHVIQEIANTSVLALCYRTRVAGDGDRRRKLQRTSV